MANLRFWDFKTILNKSGVYIIYNIDDEGFYIGSSINMRTRIKNHFSNLMRNAHHNPRFQNAWNKTTPDRFQFAMLERVQNHSELLVREIAAMRRYGVPMNPRAYNTTLPTLANPQFRSELRSTLPSLGIDTKNVPVGRETAAILNAMHQRLGLSRAEILDRIVLTFVQSILQEGE